MTEYEISDLLLTNISIMYTDGATFMTLLSAYIVVVHLVGRILTRFQITFINFTFIGLATSNVMASLSLMNHTFDLEDELTELNSNSALIADVGSEFAVVNITFRTLVVLGAVIYMWQIRRSGESRTDI